MNKETEKKQLLFRLGMKFSTVLCCQLQKPSYLFLCQQCGVNHLRLNRDQCDRLERQELFVFVVVLQDKCNELKHELCSFFYSLFFSFLQNLPKFITTSRGSLLSTKVKLSVGGSFYVGCCHCCHVLVVFAFVFFLLVLTL